jgi:hypothetical protein
VPAAFTTAAKGAIPVGTVLTGHRPLTSTSATLSSKIRGTTARPRLVSATAPAICRPMSPATTSARPFAMASSRTLSCSLLLTYTRPLSGAN